jgi:formiminotetrahydrofolate cyclodeaminase
MKGDVLAGALGTATSRMIANLTAGDIKEIYDRVDETADAQGIIRGAKPTKTLSLKNLNTR